MVAEERYGEGGFRCTHRFTFSVSLFRQSSRLTYAADVGNGQYEPISASGVQGYGSTNV